MKGSITLGLACIALSACGGDVGNGRQQTAPAPPPATQPAAPPTEPAPNAGQSDLPPPAWIETAEGSFWLGFGGFCWEGLCADFEPPACGDESTPEIEVGSGETVRVHLGFTPRTLGLRLWPAGSSLASDPRRLVLEPSTEATWSAGDSDAVGSVDATAAEGSVGYVACFRSPDPK
jgi:hypothetical protein